jgi:hypothetical protein
MLRNEDEVVQVAHDEVRFVVRPDGIFEGPYSRLLEGRFLYRWEAERRKS